jgi:predicted dehydrogenase
MRPIRFGIMGIGRIAEKFANTFRLGLVREAILLGAASSSGERAADFARKYGIPRSYPNYESLLKDPDIDIVYIANLNDRHFESCRMCFDAGKHVLCEKPMFLSAKDAKKLIRKAQQSKLFMMEAMWTRFTPAFAKAAEWIGAGCIGRLHNISASLCVARDPLEYKRLYDPKLYGGAMYDLGVYGMQTVQYFARGNALKSLQSVVVPATTGVDASTYLHMIYENGIVGEIKCSIGWYARNEAWICGDRGYIRIVPYFNFAQRVELYKPPFPSPSSLDPAQPADDFTRKSESGFEYEIDHAARCVREGLSESPVMPLSDSLEIAQIYDRLAAKLRKNYTT